jgi:hypothetical protein
VLTRKAAHTSSEAGTLGCTTKSPKIASSIKDQLNLPLRDYYHLYRAYGRMGFARYPIYHLYFVLAYLLRIPGHVDTDSGAM